MSAGPPPHELRVVAGPAELAVAAADEWRARALAAAPSGRFSVALAGGRTPQPLHALLADPREPYRDALPWALTHVFFGDERSVPPDDPASNYGAARDALLSRVPLPPGNVHRIRGEDDAGAAARAYEEELRRVLGPAARLDLVLLGLGADGHTASLFPGSPALEERTRLVAAPFVPSLGARRITLTLPALSAAARVVFLVSGAEKADALRRVLAGAAELPAARVRPREGAALFLADRAAAAIDPG